MDRFGLYGHDAPWCPFQQPENIKDREIKESVLQYKVTHSIEQDAFPEKLKEAIKSLSVTQRTRLPKPFARFAEADTPSDEDEDIKYEQSPPGSQDDNMIDTA
jgi:hypothetical protein